MRRQIHRWATVLYVSSLASFGAYGAEVGQDEATAVAQWWLTEELQANWQKMQPAELANRQDALAEPTALPLLQDNGNYMASPGAQGASGYVVTFPEGGYVIVSGDDRMAPVLAFDLEARFDWDALEGTAGRDLIGRMLSSWDSYLASGKVDRTGDGTHPRWSDLRESMAPAEALEKAPVEDAYTPRNPDMLIQFTTASWDQGGFYNDTLQPHVGGNDSVPVGCTATAMAILMRYFEWPYTGTGSNNYWDVCDGTNYYHSVTLGSVYDWSNMPLTSLTSVNDDVADLMYECAVMAGMDYEVNASAAWPSASVMNNNFRYRGTIDRSSDHADPIITCIKALVPVIVSNPSHTMVCYGYRDTNDPDFFHINAGTDGFADGWYSLDALPGSHPAIAMSCPYGTPSNYTYVNVYNTGTENGDLDTPWDTIQEGESNVAYNGQLWIKGATYTGTGNCPIVLGEGGERFTVHAYDGDAIIR